MSPPRAPSGRALGLVFVLLALLVYAPGLEGQFISDDLHYLAQNEYIHTLSVENMLAIWDPTSEVAEIVENYAPVHLTLHALDWQAFGPDVRGHHLVNVLLHALAATLLALLFRRSGVGAWPAALGAGVFLLHPANVESVAWISQLKSSSALVLSLAALLLHPRRPALALLFFALALLAKPFSASALVFVAAAGWIRPASAPGSPGDTGWFGPKSAWLVGWVAVVLAFGLAEALVFSRSAGLAPPLYPDPLIRGLMIFSLAMRYGFMIASGTGLSTFHEPPAVVSIADPWFLGGVVFLAVLCWRIFFCLRERREEAIYWLWAAAGFAPLSGVVPLPYPMADRYLYFILPGFLGALLLAGQGFVPRMERRLGSARRVRSVRLAAVSLCLAFLLVLGLLSHRRASVFYSSETLMADAERNYPEGAAASTRKASRAARRGDTQAALTYLRFAQSRGYNRVDHLLQDSAYASLQQNPEFIEIRDAMAQDWIDRLGGTPALSHYKARALAQAYVAMEELEVALDVLERAAERPGPIAGELRGDADLLRGELAFRARIEAKRAERRSPKLLGD
jgi:tetratricopeptide (TPR) repeat protein